MRLAGFLLTAFAHQEVAEAIVLHTEGVCFLVVGECIDLAVFGDHKYAAFIVLQEAIDVFIIELYLLVYHISKHYISGRIHE